MGVVLHTQVPTMGDTAAIKIGLGSSRNVDTHEESDTPEINEILTIYYIAKNCKTTHS